MMIRISHLLQLIWFVTHSMIVSIQSYVVVIPTDTKYIKSRSLVSIHYRLPYSNQRTTNVITKMIMMNHNQNEYENETSSSSSSSSTATTTTTTSTPALTSSNDEAQRLLEKVKQMRMEIATLTGQSLEDVEREAAEKRKQSNTVTSSNTNESNKTKKMKTNNSNHNKKYIIPVPETIDEQIQQAKSAIERAYHDGHINKQIIRFALISCSTNNNNNNYNNHQQQSIINDKMNQYTMFIKNEQDFPGGIQQIYREATQPYTISLLQSLRIRNSNKNYLNNNNYLNKPIINEQILWDFDGSAMIKSTTNINTIVDNTKGLVDSNGSNNNNNDTTMIVQALVQPNTDNRYFNDIIQMNEQLKHKKDNQLNLIINPFWSNSTSWGFNIFAPNAQQRAQEIIFNNNNNNTDTNDNGYIETYSIVTKSVRGEDCIAIKAYPYDWQLYAYIEQQETNNRYYSIPYTTIYLGSTVTEPNSNDFISLLNNRTEFQYSKNMRQMQQRSKWNNQD